MDIELSIPSWYATMLLFFASGVSFLNFYLDKLKKNNLVSNWLLVSAILLCMSADEGSELHELAVAPTRNLLNIESGIFYFAWVIPFGILSLALLLYFSNFWKKLEPQIKKYLLIGVLIFLSGAIGIELIGSFHVSTYAENPYVYSAIIAIEESLELLGISILIFALILRGAAKA